MCVCVVYVCERVFVSVHTRVCVNFQFGRKCDVCHSCFGIFELSMPYLKFYCVAKSNLKSVFNRHF